VDEDPREDAAAGRRDLHRNFVRLDLEKDLVGLDAVADFLVPAGDGSLGDRFTELRHQYVHRALPLRVVIVIHLGGSPADRRRLGNGRACPRTRGLRYQSTSSLTRATILSTLGICASSKLSAAASGTCGVVIRTIGPSRSQNSSSATIDAISAPHPQSRGFSSTVTRRPVCATSSRIVCVSSGTSERTSTTVARMPCSFSRISAACIARGTISASAAIVTSSPRRSTFALPSGSTCSPSGTSPFVAYSDFCSKNSTGSSSRIDAASRPLTSAGYAGATTLSPGIAIAQFSTLCECCAPKREPPPLPERITSGSLTCPSVM